MSSRRRSSLAPQQTAESVLVHHAKSKPAGTTESEWASRPVRAQPQSTPCFRARCRSPASNHLTREERISRRRLFDHARLALRPDRPVFLRGFRNLEAVLEKGEAFALEQGIDPVSLVEARLAPDMLPLSGQIQRASDTAKGLVGRLGGAPVAGIEDNETTFADLYARIAKTVDILNGAPRGSIDGKEDADLVLTTRAGDQHFRGVDYALGFALPNFFFHVTTAYAILRHNGAPIGKRDYLGNA